MTRRQLLARAATAGMASFLGARAPAWAVPRRAPAAAAGTVRIGGDLVVNRMGFGAMRLTGPGIWGEPNDAAEARRVLRRAVELGVNFIDTADAYGPEVSERLIKEAFHPYPSGLVIATKGGTVRPQASQWLQDGTSPTAPLQTCSPCASASDWCSFPGCRSRAVPRTASHAVMVSWQRGQDLVIRPRPVSQAILFG